MERGKVARSPVFHLELCVKPQCSTMSGTHGTLRKNLVPILARFHLDGVGTLDFGKANKST